MASCRLAAAYVSVVGQNHGFLQRRRLATEVSEVADVVASHADYLKILVRLTAT